MPIFETFNLPDAGEGLTEADVVTWLVRIGDTVEVNQPLVEIETAKSLVEIPCPVDGLVTELLVHEGDTVNVGSAIVVFDIDPNGPVPEPIVAMPESAPPEPEPSFSMPRLDEPEPTVDEPVSDGASGSVLVGYGVSATEAVRRPRRVEVFSSFGEESDAEISHPVFAKPPVRRLARELGIDLSTVSPSGPGGIVTREDVIQHAKETEPRTLATYAGDDMPWLESGVVSADGRLTRVPVKSVRKRTAEAMVRSAFTAPHVTVFHTLDVSATMDLVARLKQDREFADVKVTPLLIVAKALLFAVRRHPEINATWDDERQEIVYKHYVNLGIAATTPRGLIVPNIKDAHRYDLHTLAQEVMQLTTDARNGTTPPSATQDGTITITNVGVFGIDTGTPILNPGEAAILAFGAIRQQPWVHEGVVAVRWVTQLALSFDHRLVDGELGSRVLADVAAVLGDPSKALVWG
ncbi:MAG: 2-oxo acid dehydrogenase subunit E2 [Demequinaceae bacterium]|nr:2-oxo acid dehydrogenase subunit E2 [Demequinaceae bacterium]